MNVKDSAQTLWDVGWRVGAITGVRETETLLEMQVHKFTYRDVAGPAGADHTRR